MEFGTIKNKGKESLMRMTSVETKNEAADEGIFDLFSATKLKADTAGIEEESVNANERAINQVDYTTINLGTSSYSRMVDESAVLCSDFENVSGGNKSDGRGEIAQGDAGYKNAYTPTIQVVEVYENNTTKIQRKMSNPDGTARKVGEDWLIPVVKSKSDFNCILCPFTFMGITTIISGY